MLKLVARRALRRAYRKRLAMVKRAQPVNKKPINSDNFRWLDVDALQCGQSLRQPLRARGRPAVHPAGGV